MFLMVCSWATALTPPRGLWSDWEPYLGTWQGTGTGDPGQGRGEFRFELRLQGVVLVRHSYAENATTEDKPANRHEDLMVIYPDADSKKTRTDYGDDEGHVIHYEVALSAS